MQCHCIIMFINPFNEAFQSSLLCFPFFSSSSYLKLNNRAITIKNLALYSILGDSSVNWILRWRHLCGEFFSLYRPDLKLIALMIYKLVCSGALIPAELASFLNDEAGDRAEEELTQWFGSSNNHDYNDSLLQSALDLDGTDMRRFTVIGTGIRASGLRQKTDGITIPKGVQNMVPSF